MPTAIMASNKMLAKNLQTLFLLLANFAGVLAQEQSQRIPFQDQVAFTVFSPWSPPIWSNWKYATKKKRLKWLKRTPCTRSSSLRVFSAAPVFFSSWPSSPSLSVFSSELLLQRDFCSDLDCYHSSIMLPAWLHEAPFWHLIVNDCGSGIASYVHLEVNPFLLRCDMIS